MVQIAPVNYEHARRALDYVTVARSNPIEGNWTRLHFTPNLVLRVETPPADEDRMQLAAGEAEDILHALTQAVSRHADGPATASVAPAGAGHGTWDIELGWNGTHYRFHSVTWGADDAITSLLDVLHHAATRAQQHASRRRGE